MKKIETLKKDTKKTMKTRVKMMDNFGPRKVITAEIKPEETVTKYSSFEKNKKIKNFLIIFVLLIILIFGSTAYYFYNKYKNAPMVENEEIMLKVGKLMMLPQNEGPTLATVTDKDKMKDQAFFANSENGDKVLIYTKAQKAILYRPSSNMIIEVMPLSISNTNPQQAESTVNPSQTAPVATEKAQPVSDKQQAQESTEVSMSEIKVAIYNGSNIKGKAGTVGIEIAKIEGMKIGEKTNAIGSFEETIVVDLSGKNSEGAQKIADAIGGKVGDMPEGEKRPESDILVITGKN